MKKKKTTAARELKSEEKLLWNLVTRTVTPIKSASSSTTLDEDLAQQMASLMTPPIKSAPLSKAGLKAAKRASSADQNLSKNHDPSKKPLLPKQSPVSPNIDKPVYRKIAKGRVAIDGKIDLHDMTQDQAIFRLQNFLAQSRDCGHRHVLVITGKGGSPTSEGILKRMLPIWLNTPAFSSIVNGYQTASRGHGGEGAFYVRLRR